MEQQPLLGSILPDPHGIIDGVKESIHDIADPLRIFSDESSTPAQSRELIEVMGDMEYAVSKKQFQVAEALIDEGRGTTNCGWCQNKLNRTEIDVKYADGVCRVGTKEECEAGARVVAGKINNVTTTLKMATDDTKKELEENGAIDHD